MLGPSKSIRYSGDFIIAGFVIVGFVSIYFYYCNSARLSNVHYNGVFIIAGCHCRK